MTTQVKRLQKKLPPGRGLRKAVKKIRKRLKRVEKRTVRAKAAMTVYVVTPKGERITLRNVRPTSTVRSIKRMLRRKAGPL